LKVSDNVTFGRQRRPEAEVHPTRVSDNVTLGRQLRHGDRGRCGFFVSDNVTLGRQLRRRPSQATIRAALFQTTSLLVVNCDRTWNDPQSRLARFRQRHSWSSSATGLGMTLKAALQVSDNVTLGRQLRREHPMW
jgi:hypothetical protein